MSEQIVLFILILINLIIFIKFKYIANLIKIYDYPDQKRKFHKNPTPILGGLIIYLSILILFFIENFFFPQNSYMKSYEGFIFLIFLSAIFLVYLYDDLKSLGPNIKLALLIIIILFYLILDQSLIITNLQFSFLEKKILLNKFSIPFTILCFILFINAFNMFDGINLQCGLYSLQIFILIYFLTNNIFFIYLIIPILFFLVLNYLNLCFLGNNGTSILSFIICVVVIQNYNFDKNILADEIFLLMCVPGFDLLRLAIKRIMNKSHPFYPDRNHIHHLLLKKYGTKNVIWIIQLLIFTPILFSFVFEISSIILIIFSVTMYAFLVIEKKI